MNVPHQRLLNQHISKPSFQKPGEVVRWLGAAQSQDYAAAKWALGLRCSKASEAVIERAFANGDILRTHVMRPTWHFVTPENIRWLLALTAARVHAAAAFQYRRLELDQATFKRSNAALTKALRDGKQLRRDEIKSVFEGAGIDASDLRSAHLLMHAELEGILCSGGRRGKQFTYALLDERAPVAKPLSHDEALTELTRRYFTSHGPATEKDFIWWSGLSRSDVKNGIEMAKRSLDHEVMDGRTYWFAASMKEAKANNAVYLLPNYDEYIVGYTDRSAIFDSSHAEKLDDRHNPLFQHTLVINGQVAGTWKRTLKKDTVEIELNPFAPLTKVEQQAVDAAADEYGAFLGMKAAMGE